VSRWRCPFTTTAGESREATAKQAPDGSVQAVEVEQFTGDEKFRRAVEATICRADPLTKASTPDIYNSVLKFSFMPVD
jgi:hypothetical protein